MSGKSSRPGTAREDKGVNIQVAVRCRPRNSTERAESNGIVVKCNSEEKEIAMMQNVAGKKTAKTFGFDSVFGPESTQADVYNGAVRPVVEEALRGFSCCIFAYGQTGTGKTFTMEGSREPGKAINDVKGAGVIPRATEHIFQYLESLGTEYSVRVSFLELYNEELNDLLEPTDIPKKLRIYEDNTKAARGIMVQNLEEVVVNDAQHIYDILDVALKKRVTAETLLNHASSRSHTIFTITIHMKEVSPDGEELLKVGKLNLVDLAGSENIGRSGARDERRREAGLINQSLLTLSRVITALVDHTPHVPYRESKLTRLLQDALGGRSKTCIIATVSPAASNMEETSSTLDYAYRAKHIRNRPEVNQRLTKRAMIKEMNAEIERLKKELVSAREKNGVYMPLDQYESMQAKIDATGSSLQESVAELAAKQKELADLTASYEETCVKLADAREQHSVTMEAVESAHVAVQSHVEGATVASQKFHDSMIARAEAAKEAADAGVDAVSAATEKTQSALSALCEALSEARAALGSRAEAGGEGITGVSGEIAGVGAGIESSVATAIAELLSQTADAAASLKTAISAQADTTRAFGQDVKERASAEVRAVSEWGSAHKTRLDGLKEAIVDAGSMQAAVYAEQAAELEKVKAAATAAADEQMATVLAGMNALVQQAFEKQSAVVQQGLDGVGAIGTRGAQTASTSVEKLESRASAMESDVQDLVSAREAALQSGNTAVDVVVADAEERTGVAQGCLEALTEVVQSTGETMKDDTAQAAAAIAQKAEAIKEQSSALVSEVSSALESQGKIVIDSMAEIKEGVSGATQTAREGAESVKAIIAEVPESSESHFSAQTEVFGAVAEELQTFARDYDAKYGESDAVTAVDGDASASAPKKVATLASTENDSQDDKENAPAQGSTSPAMVRTRSALANIASSAGQIAPAA